VNRCIAFFKDAAQDAGLTVSPYITQKKPRNGNAKKVPRKQESGDKVNPPAKPTVFTPANP
jgi:hypothetical protein